MFTNQLRSKARVRTELAAALSKALREGELTIEYQPIFSAVSERAEAAEALVRWNHPDPRPDRSRRLHPDRRRDRRDRADRRLGAAAGLRGDPHLDRQRRRRAALRRPRQRVTAATVQPVVRQSCGRPPPRLPVAATPDRARSARGNAARRQRRRRALGASPSARRRPGRARQLRHRLERARRCSPTSAPTCSSSTVAWRCRREPPTPTLASCGPWCCSPMPSTWRSSPSA